MKYKTYDQYIDSDIKWIGKIPVHWTVERIKDCLNFKIGGTPPTNVDEFFEGDNIWVSIADINNTAGNIIYDSTIKISDDAIRKSNVKLISKGSLLYSFKLSVGLTAFAGCDLYTNEAIASFEQNQKVNLNYLKYVFQSGFENNAAENIYGAKLFNSELIKFSKFVLAPLDEQQQIANYLDIQTAKIDEIIIKNKQLLKLLNEKRVTLINHVVTKGLNPDAPMKDSGIDIVGSIPRTNNIVRLKFLCDIKTGDKDTVDRNPEGKYPFYVRSPNVERIDTYSYNGESVLMAGDGVGAGKVFHYVNGKFDYHQRVYNLHNFKHVVPKFIYYYMSSLFSIEIDKGSAKSTVDSVRLPMLENFLICYPKKEEQNNIVDFLDNETAKIEQIISKVKENINLLEEYKTSLIHHVVTGKVDIRSD